jgi:hypothetical protein
LSGERAASVKPSPVRENARSSPLSPGWTGVSGFAGVLEQAVASKAHPAAISPTRLVFRMTQTTSGSDLQGYMKQSCGGIRAEASFFEEMSNILR